MRTDLEFHLEKRVAGEAGAIDLHLSGTVDDGVLGAVFGTSGSGKTTLLRLLAGLTRPDRGTIRFGETVWVDTGAGRFLPPQQRPVGLVFQDYALFPNMSVAENVGFAMAGRPRDGDVLEWLKRVGLADLADRRPATLSGGQRQRLAIARALARRPRLLLLDEPLAALDSGMRERLQELILDLHGEYGLTTLLVSHELAEVFRMATTVLVLEGGTVRRQGPPAEVLLKQRPGGQFQVEGRVLRIEPETPGFVVTVAIGNQSARVFAGPDEAAPLKVGSRVVVSARAFNPLLLPLEKPGDGGASG